MTARGLRHSEIVSRNGNPYSERAGRFGTLGLPSGNETGLHSRKQDSGAVNRLGDKAGALGGQQKVGVSSFLWMPCHKGLRIESFE